MYKEVLKNLLDSITIPQLINTEEDDIEAFFNGGRRLYFVHLLTNKENASEDIVNAIEKQGITFDFLEGNLMWFNIKGNVDFNDVTDIMSECGDLFDEAFLSVSADDMMEDVEVSVIVGK